MTIIAIFAMMFVVGLVGTIWAYVQPEAGSWGVVFVFMMIIGAIGFMVSLVWRIVKRGKG